MAEQFSLKWSNFQSTIISAFESLHNTEDLADVTLTCEGLNLKAHKVILSACSPYFRTVFKENPCSHPIVILKDVLYTDLLAILKFMYHGEVLLNKDHLNSFLKTAEILQVSGLIGSNEFTSKSGDNHPNSVSRPNKSTTRLSENVESPLKKAKVVKKVDTTTTTVPVFNEHDDIELVCVSEIKTEIEEENVVDMNENVSNVVEKSGCSLLEAALDSNTNSSTSILERSLKSSGKSPVLLQSRKPPPDYIRIDNNLSINDTATESQSINNSKETPFQLIKTEEEHEEIEVTPDNIVPPVDDSSGGGGSPLQLLRNPQQPSQPPQLTQPTEAPHHSSQCGNCPHCGKTYSNQSALKYHVRLVHSDLLNLYCCHLCPQTFDYREGYKKHMVEVHSVRN